MLIYGEKAAVQLHARFLAASYISSFVALLAMVFSFLLDVVC